MIEPFTIMRMPIVTDSGRYGQPKMIVLLLQTGPIQPDIIVQVLVLCSSTKMRIVADRIYETD